jgi:hypothetical protein
METFLVRLWLPEPASESARSDLRGVVERPGTSESYPFRGDRELLSTLRARLEDGRQTARASSQESWR